MWRGPSARLTAEVKASLVSRLAFLLLWRNGMPNFLVLVMDSSWGFAVM